MKPIQLFLIIMVLLVVPAGIRADIVQLDLKALGCPTAFSWSSAPWTTSFDLGVTFTSIQSVSIEWGGTLNGAWVYDFSTGQASSADVTFSAYMDNFRYASVRSGASTYPDPQAFEVQSVIRQTPLYTDWTDLLDGKGSIELSFRDPLHIDGIVLQHGSGTLTGAVLTVDGTVIPEPTAILLLGFGGGLIRRFRKNR